MKFMVVIKELFFKVKQQEKLIILWDIVYIGIMGTVSFIILYIHNKSKNLALHHTDSIAKVIIAAMLICLLVFIAQVIIYIRRKTYVNRRTTLYKTRIINRLVYMTINLVIIIIYQIEIGVFDTSLVPRSVVLQSAFMFIITVLLGTSSLWFKKLFRLIQRPISKQFEIRRKRQESRYL